MRQPRSIYTGLATGFTLVEILIVVVILGILASIVIPQFSNASHSARQNTLKDDLRFMRMQITVFKAQHEDVGPGYPSGNPGGQPTEADLVAQLTQYTSASCGVSATWSVTHKFGPYLSKAPTNPLNGKSSFRIVADSSDMPAPDGTTGWIYKPATSELTANLTGTDEHGKLYAAY